MHAAPRVPQDTTMRYGHLVRCPQQFPALQQQVSAAVVDAVLAMEQRHDYVLRCMDLLGPLEPFPALQQHVVAALVAALGADPKQAVAPYIVRDTLAAASREEVPRELRNHS